MKREKRKKSQHVVQWDEVEFRLSVGFLANPGSWFVLTLEARRLVTWCLSVSVLYSIQKCVLIFSVCMFYLLCLEECVCIAHQLSQVMVFLPYDRLSLPVSSVFPGESWPSLQQIRRLCSSINSPLTSLSTGFLQCDMQWSGVFGGVFFCSCLGHWLDEDISMELIHCMHQRLHQTQHAALCALILLSAAQTSLGESVSFLVLWKLKKEAAGLFANSSMKFFCSKFNISDPKDKCCSHNSRLKKRNKKGLHSTVSYSSFRFQQSVSQALFTEMLRLSPQILNK